MIDNRDIETPEWSTWDWTIIIGCIVISSMLGFGFMFLMWGWKITVLVAASIALLMIALIIIVNEGIKRYE